MEAPTLTARPWILKPWSLNRPMGLLGHRVAWGGLTERNLWPVATGAYSRVHVLAEGWCTKSVRIRLAAYGATTVKQDAHSTSLRVEVPHCRAMTFLNAIRT